MFLPDKQFRVTSLTSNKNSGTVATDWRVLIDSLHQDATAVSEICDKMHTEEGRTHCRREAEELRSQARFMEQTVELVGDWNAWE